MSLQLYPEDCQAIDLLLDQGIRPVAGKSSPPASNAPATSARERLSAIHRVLGLLDLMPAPEPPANLVSKTLARIAAAPSLPANPAMLQPTRIRRDQPTA